MVKMFVNLLSATMPCFHKLSRIPSYNVIQQLDGAESRQYALAYYNTRRPHSALGYTRPASRLCGKNPLQLNTTPGRQYFGGAAEANYHCQFNG